LGVGSWDGPILLGTGCLAWYRSNPSDDAGIQETLIVWSEGDNCDYALSFQEKKGCDEVWEKICQVSVLVLLSKLTYIQHSVYTLTSRKLMTATFSALESPGNFPIASQGLEINGNSFSPGIS